MIGGLSRFPVPANDFIFSGGETANLFSLSIDETSKFDDRSSELMPCMSPAFVGSLENPRHESIVIWWNFVSPRGKKSCILLFFNTLRLVRVLVHASTEAVRCAHAETANWTSIAVAIEIQGGGKVRWIILGRAELKSELLLKIWWHQHVLLLLLVGSGVLSLIHHTLSHVLLEGRRNTEWHFTEATSVDILAESAVRLHVTRELGALSARIWTQFTLVRLLAGVRTTVDRKIGAVLEDFATIFTGIVSSWFLLRRTLQRVWVSHSLRHLWLQILQQSFVAMEVREVPPAVIAVHLHALWSLERVLEGIEKWNLRQLRVLMMLHHAFRHQFFFQAKRGGKTVELLGEPGNG